MENKQLQTHSHNLKRHLQYHNPQQIPKPALLDPMPFLDAPTFTFYFDIFYRCEIDTSLSHRKIVGYASTLKNNHLNLSRAYTKLFSFSAASKQNATENVNLIDVIQTTLSNDILYLLVLHVLSINMTMLKKSTSFTESHFLVSLLLTSTSFLYFYIVSIYILSQSKIIF